MLYCPLTVIPKATLYSPIITTLPDPSLSNYHPPEDWHWVSHAVTTAYVPLTCPWVRKEVLAFFSCVQASALCCSPIHQVYILSFCSHLCPAWFLSKCSISFLWNEDPILPSLWKLCPQGLESGGRRAPVLGSQDSPLSCSAKDELWLLKTLSLTLTPFLSISSLVTAPCLPSWTSCFHLLLGLHRNLPYLIN